jgi:ABC-2 type transport system ATP-binding protein
LSQEKSYPKNTSARNFGVFTAVNDISFEVNKGEILVFGANGAGKQQR